MLDGVSLDQLRTFIAAADAGSFSAGARQLRRAQSVVSQTLANLEAQVGVKLFDRSRRAPVLTKEGVALVAEARAVVSGMDGFKARAKGLSDGLEPELSVVVDVIFPLERLTAAVAAFQGEFPSVPLRLYVGARPGATPAARPHGPFGAFAGKRVRRFFREHLAARRSWREARVPARRLGLGRHAGGRDQTRSGKSIAGENPDRGCPRGPPRH